MRQGTGILIKVCLMLLALCSAQAVPAQESAPVPLPVRKVVLYKNGMGYFEHVGRIRGAQSVEITLPSSQLNDVLKSLTVLDLGGGRISGVTYDSTAPLERQLRDLPVDLRKAGSLVGFLNQITGAAVEVRAPGGAVSGKVMRADVRRRVGPSGEVTEVVELSVFTPSGEMRIVELESAGGLRFTDATLAGNIGRYLDLVNTENQRDIRRLKIQTVGSGRRDLFVSYTAEAPIWKMTYRIVLDDKRKPLLQGWAIVDNTTPMDWEGVELSLVAGAPISFIHNLSQPVYGRRPVVPLPQGVQVSPQTHEGTMEGAPAEPSAARNAFALAEEESDKAELRSGVGRGSGGGMARRSARSIVLAPGAVNVPDLGEAVRAAGAGGSAQGRSLGEQFEYKLSHPVTIGKNQSALLPILQTEVEADKVSLFNASHGGTRPLLAVWLKNTSGLTLDAGAFTVIDTNAFAGEGLTETILPDESRLLSYAVDLGVEITTNRGSEQKRVERVVINRGMMWFHRKLVETRTYTIRNNAKKPRTVVLEHRLRGNWELVDTPEPQESSANHYRFQVAAEPSATTEFVVREESPQQTTYALSTIDSDMIALWVRQKDINPAIEKLLRPLAAKKAGINDLQRQMAELEREQNEIFRDQKRVRDNLNRMGRTPEEARLRQRYIRQMEAQENRLEAIRAERERLQASLVRAQNELAAMLDGLTFDREL